MNKINNKTVYLGGHILNEAMVNYRQKQHKEVESIKGITPYSPHNDKSINDKANAVQEGLAERILNNDFKEMQESDVYVFDILNEGLGTISELGILLGMKHQAEELIKHIYDNGEEYFNYTTNRFETSLSTEDKLMIDKLENIINKPVFCYCSDIRQGHGKPYNNPDRAEFSTNQFVYGMVLSLTNGVGFISWEQVKKELENLSNK